MGLVFRLECRAGCLKTQCGRAAHAAQNQLVSTLSKIQRILSLCRDLTPEAWPAILERECGGDADLRKEIERQLAEVRNHSGYIATNDPEMLGPYRIRNRIGEGGMGIVYLAAQRQPIERLVAIKILRNGYRSRDVLARFDAERHALTLMTHPNVARILDAGSTDDHRPYIVMEYVAGVPVIEYCRQRNLTVEQRLKLFIQICDAVQHAHQKGIIHRDLKPSNILVGEDNSNPVPKIIDFGIAKATAQPLTEFTLDTRIGTLLGTPEYMSPEQSELTTLDLDTRTDVYSLGAVLYELLANKPPFDFSGEETPYSEIQRRLREEKPLPPSSYRQDKRVRGELDWITMKALEKQRGLRYASAAELAQDISNYLSDRPIIAGPPSKLRASMKFLRRHWPAAAALTAIAATLAISQIILMHKNRELQWQRDRANIEAAASESVTNFLLGIFKASDPRNPDAGNITARELLDRGREEIDNNTSLTPEVRRRLLIGLGDAYTSLGAHEEAIRSFRQALEIRQGLSPNAEFSLLAKLGMTLELSRRTLEAREVLAQVVSLAKQVPNPDEVTLFNVRRVLASLERDAGNNGAAQRMLETLLRETRISYGDADERTLDIAARLVYVYSSGALFEQALTLSEEMLPLAIDALGQTHPISSYLMGNLGGIYMSLNRWKEAERINRQVYEQLQARFGADAAPTQQALAALAVSLPDRQEGIRLLLDLETQQRNKYGNDSPRLIVTLQDLGWIYIHVPGKETEARRYYDAALALAEKHLGTGHESLHSIYYGIAELHANTGQLKSALAWLHKASADPAMRFRAANDPYFSVLANDPEFLQLLGEFAPWKGDAG